MEIKQERIAKVLARAGVCSRREAERLIEQGRVSVDGSVLTTPATLVDDKSKILVDNKPIGQVEETRVWCYYKPTGYVTTHSDPEGRSTVFEDLKKHKLPRVISVGRLDLNSEGLLILTNDGAFARYAELPSTRWPRCYRVRVFGDLDLQALLDLKKGITIEGMHYDSIEVEISDRSFSSLNTWLTVTLYEGKNREIRKVMNHLGLKVNRLIRNSYGPFSLKDLKPHDIREVPTNIIKKILE